MSYIAEMLEFIEGHWAEYGYAPTLREIQASMKISSLSVVSYRLRRMREEGLITYQDDKARTIRVQIREGIHE